MASERPAGATERQAHGPVRRTEAPGGFDALTRAVDLVNALRHEPEEHADRAALREVLRLHGEGEVTLAAADVAEIREAVGSLRRVFATDDPDTAAELLNELLAGSARAPFLSRHEGHVWHLHVTSEDAPWRDWVLASSALALAELLGRLGGCGWGQCGSSSCTRFFVHDGRGGRRRYCSQRCSSRQRVADHRARAGADR